MSRLVFYSNDYGSGETRAKQIASYLNTACDANQLYTDDVVICVKTYLHDNITKHVRKVYIDVVDWCGLFDYMRQHPEVGIIAISETAKRFISKELNRDDIVVIPEHHCNFEKVVLKVSKPKTVGFIGYPESFKLDTQVVKASLKSIGLDFKYYTNFESRKDVCDFYRSVDIQLTFRPNESHSALRNPLKIVNAGSFGIPSVCYPEQSYVEASLTFDKANNLAEVISCCNNLANDNDYYRHVSSIVVKEAEQYHIENISKLYLELIT